jgi:hypothetical protein
MRSAAQRQPWSRRWEWNSHALRETVCRRLPGPYRRPHLPHTADIRGPRDRPCIAGRHALVGGHVRQCRRCAEGRCAPVGGRTMWAVDQCGSEERMEKGWQGLLGQTRLSTTQSLFSNRKSDRMSNKESKVHSVLNREHNFFQSQWRNVQVFQCQIVNNLITIPLSPSSSRTCTACVIVTGVVVHLSSPRGHRHFFTSSHGGRAPHSSVPLPAWFRCTKFTELKLYLLHPRSYFSQHASYRYHIYIYIYRNLLYETSRYHPLGPFIYVFHPFSETNSILANN